MKLALENLYFLFLFFFFFGKTRPRVGIKTWLVFFCTFRFLTAVRMDVLRTEGQQYSWMAFVA